MIYYVCVKAVPDSEEIRFDRQTGTMQRTGTNSMINPSDLVAVEAALQSAARFGGEVHGVSMGPEAFALPALRTALAMGCTQGVLLASPQFSGADVGATAYTLAAFLRTVITSSTLIFCGKYAADGDTGQVGSWLAEELGIPHAAAVCEIGTLQETMLHVTQRLEDQLLQTAITMPSLLVVENDAYFPRIPSLAGLLRSKRQPIQVLTEQTLPIELTRCGHAGSATQVKKLFVPKRHTHCTMLTADGLDQLLPIFRGKGGNHNG